MLLKEIYENAKVVSSGKHFTTVNEFTDQIPALRPRVLWEAALKISQICDFKADKIVTEEDKGTPLATVVSLISGLPMAIARWYNYSLEEESQIAVNIDSEYFNGKLFLNGVNKKDKVIIIDDTLSTGGTIVSLVKAIRESGAEVVDVVCVIEKEGYGGRERVLESTGIEVKTIHKILVNQNGVKVIS
ncbi:adenine phosphoribosyltransferase [Ruminiclostridium cellulolyticum]|uniref:Phosphoribosyltransferase n=1 Tax=Ruminiclostridium cellulolyticum (strain ATCC 35319 / DSM 5812 / JCM 6584 / H10) TaxID=394503 RepID=B8I5Y1_RUMCH|nr:adenine phosphoribosyltransferase [Ruminiclostridium cellulolyticum]ACL74798.1 phosphoribosyltransferase [Ruminiclostridium cellulolyticum H10]